MKKDIPPQLKGEIKQDVFDKAQDYSRAKMRFGWFSGAVSMALNMAIIYYDALPWFWKLTGTWMMKYIPSYAGEVCR